MSYSELKAALRALPADASPTSLQGFRVLGSGTYRTAYSNGTFVVKHRAGNWRCITPGEARAKNRETYELRSIEAKVRLAPTVLVGDWVIQLAYEPLVKPEPCTDAPSRIKWSDRIRVAVNKLSADEQRAIGATLDGHGGNFGRDKRGRLVCFDW